MPGLDEAAAVEVLLEDDILDRLKHKLDVVCVGGTCDVIVDVLIGVFVEVQELILQVLASVII